jgi:hypothetical protein
MHTYAAELVAMKPDAILAITTAALVPLRKATSSIPIVFVNVGDPATRAQATVRVWKNRLEHQAHSRSNFRDGCGLPVVTEVGL